MGAVIDPSTDGAMRPPNSFRLVVPFLPPTANNIYITDWRQKRRFKSSEAKAFVQKFNERVVPTYLPWISRMVGPEDDPKVCYQVSVDIYFPRDELVNKTYGKKGGAKTWYKKMDAGNRAKLIVDCTAKAVGIDDAHFFLEGARKLCAEGFGVEPQAHVFLYRLEPSLFGLDHGE